MKMLLPSRKQKSPILTLTRHFFDRLFQNDIVSFEEQMTGRIIAVMAILSVYFGFVAFWLTGHYTIFPDQGTSWQEKFIMLAITMLVIAVLSLLEWDSLFLDSRDYAHFAPLPLNVRTLFLAKFLSLFIFSGIFALGINVLVAFTFFSTFATYVSNKISFIPYFFLVHFLASFAASFFTLFFFASFVGALSVVLGEKIFKKVSSYIRGILLVIAVFLGLNALTIDVTFYESLAQTLASWKAQALSKMILVPPLWFTGLYETLLGNKDPIFHALASVALLSIPVSLGALYMTVGLSFRRHLKKFTAAIPRKKLFFRLKESVFHIMQKLLLRHPDQRAVFDFYRKTMKSSQIHRTRLIGFLAAGTGIILFYLLGWRVSLTSLSEVNRISLSIPLIFNLFLILGIRNVVNVPSALEANWIFQLTEKKSLHHYLSGLRKGILFLNILPISILFFVFYALLWDATTASYFLVYILGISILLVEVFFARYHKIPFACSYIPGKEKFHIYLIFYIIGFVLYYFLTTSVATVLLQNPLYLAVFWAGILVSVLGLRLYQNRFFYPRTQIIYEEEIEPVMVTLDSSF